MNIGRYEVIRPLGRGGMAFVYLAHDPFIKRQVAVKVLPHQFTHDPEFRNRFAQEAQVIATLEHAYIVPVYDYGEHEDQPFIVMRYLPGGTLNDRLNIKAFEVSQLIHLFQNIAIALDYAHRNGIIHRDIKPGNILFDTEDKAHLSDFGIAKIQEASAAFTGTGNLIGTPDYMSPEQAKGEKMIDGRADIYSLGVVLFQCLSRELPFKADTPMGVAIAHIQQPVPSVLPFRPDLPSGFDVIIRKAMDKDPAGRYRTATELSEAISHQVKLLGMTAETTTQAFTGTSIKQSLQAQTSRLKPTGEVAPVQPGIVPPPPTPHQFTPAPTKSNLPRLIGVGSALLLFLLCIAVIGGLATGLIPNPFASVLLTESIETPTAETPEEIIPVPSQAIDVSATSPAQAPTETSSATPEALLPVITDKGTIMVLVPAGEFLMGGNDPNAESDERTVHAVLLDDYYIDKFEVTNAAYQACVTAGACKPPIQTDSFTRSKYYGVQEYNEYPVVFADWSMSNTYCEWRGARLPTEAEWEKAARGSDDQRFYPWGTATINCQMVNYDGANGCYGGTTRVGSYEGGKSPYDVYDMAGNVWEWVADWYSETYYNSSPTKDPTGPDAGLSRVLRGGSWTRREYDIRVSNRNKYSPGYYNFDIGFRCARDVSP